MLKGLSIADHRIVSARCPIIKTKKLGRNFSHKFDQFTIYLDVLEHISNLMISGRSIKNLFCFNIIQCLKYGKTE